MKNTKKTPRINDKFNRNMENSNVFSNISFLSHLDFQEYCVVSVLSLSPGGFQQHSCFQTHQNPPNHQLMARKSSKHTVNIPNLDMD